MKCPECEGKGTHIPRRTKVETCLKCDGTGIIPDEPDVCGLCSNEGNLTYIGCNDFVMGPSDVWICGDCHSNAVMEE